MCSGLPCLRHDRQGTVEGGSGDVQYKVTTGRGATRVDAGNGLAREGYRGMAFVRAAIDQAEEWAMARVIEGCDMACVV